jgi:hypothetical protein
MSRRTATLLAWSMCALCLALTALSFSLLFFSLSHPGVPVYRYWAEGTFLGVGYSAVGAVVASSRPQHPIGWLLCALGLLWGVIHFAAEYAVYVLLAVPGALPLGEVAAWIASWLWVPGLGVIVFVGLLFPSGRLPSRRWRLFAWLSFLSILVGAAVTAFSPGQVLGFRSIRNPLGIEGLPNLREQLQALMFALIFVASASMLGRLRRASGVERQQIKWVAYAAMVAASASLPTYTVFEAMNVRWLALVGYVFVLVGILGIPTAMGIAMLRYRLYDIDLLINRTLVYGALTASLAAVYVGSVVLLQGVLRALTGQESQLAVVASTLAIAALFNPLRRRLQWLVDRRFYRRKYDARKTLEAFSAKLRDKTDLDALSDDLVGVVRQTMQPAHVSLWLRPDTTAKKDEASG